MGNIVNNAFALIKTKSNYSETNYGENEVLNYNTQFSSGITHNLKNFKSYPIHHRWIVNSNVLNVFSNERIRLQDTIVLNGKTYGIEDILKRENPSPVYLDSKEHGYITKDTRYYELLLKD